MTDRAAAGVDTARLAAIADGVLAREGRAMVVHVAVVDDEEMRELHRRFHGIDTPTDVISFGLDEDDDDPTPDEATVHAEIVVSVDTARREAAARGVDPDAELALYVIHGVLHVIGYDDLDDASRAAMRDAEARHLEAAGLPSDLYRAGTPADDAAEGSA